MVRHSRTARTQVTRTCTDEHGLTDHGLQPSNSVCLGSEPDSRLSGIVLDGARPCSSVGLVAGGYLFFGR